MTEENYNYRTSPMFLRNQFEGSGQFDGERMLFAVGFEVAKNHLAGLLCRKGVGDSGIVGGVKQSRLLQPLHRFPGEGAGCCVDELEKLPAGIPQPENDPAQFDWFRELDPKGEGRLFEPADFGGGGRDEPQFHRGRGGVAPADGGAVPAGAGQRGRFDFHLIQAGNFPPFQLEFCIAELQKFSGGKRREEETEKEWQKELVHIVFFR